MYLKELRSVIPEQVKTKVYVNSGDDNVASGELWFFSIDKSLDDLEVKSLYPKDGDLVLNLECSQDQLKDYNWADAFNQDEVIISENNGPIDTISPQGE